jgi:hypothetical protein
LDKLAVAENINMDHHSLLNDTSILGKISKRMDRTIREVTKPELHPKNMKRG